MSKIFEGLFIISFILIALGFLYSVKDEIYVYVDRYISPNKYVTLGEKNEYYRNIDFKFVQNTNQFTPLSRQDIINIYYTVMNAGKSSFTFYCTDEFPDCLNVIEEIANDQNILSDINNYVHPYNAFSHIETQYDNYGKVTISIVHSYKQEEIDEINQKINELAPQLIKETDTDYNNIKRIHDYIINNAVYDTPRVEEGDKSFKSDIAYGPLFQGKAVCGGYTDLMQLYLEKLNIPNFKVSSEKHIWNAVYINGQWLNLDLTWDDPVYEDGSQHLEYRFFLIDTQKLRNEEQAEHTFNTNSYLELIQR